LRYNALKGGKATGLARFAHHLPVSVDGLSFFEFAEEY